MCGIAGVIELTGKEANVSELHVLRSHISERGPDSSGVFRNRNVGLVHTRLSIIDLSETGSQPMSINYKGATYTIVLNGEIYNFHELRDTFLSGISLKGRSDTEVLLWVYILQGPEAIARLRGMFAFAIYNERDRKLLLARDHFGKKPLYIYQGPEKIVFSSDIRGIRSVCSGLSLNYETLNYYLTELTSPQPHTIWREINQLEPGYYAEVDLDTGHTEKKSYFHFPAPEKMVLTFDEALLRVESGLQQAILKRRQADVSIGYFLSGGVDSGLIVALAASQAPVSTYSVGYHNSDMNELADARIVAERYGTRHQEIILEPDIARDLEDIIACFGEPFADASAIPSFYIAKEMKKNVSVAISGDGGDELFGYPSYAFYHSGDIFRSGASDRRTRQRIWWSRLHSRLKRNKVNYGQYRSLFVKGSRGNLFRRGMAFSEDSLMAMWKSDQGLASVGFTESYLNAIWDQNYRGTIVDSVFQGSFRTRLLNDYLVKVDRTGMKNALEIRSPFLDIDFALDMMKLPNEFKFRDNQPKYILKKLAEKWVDPEIMKRKKRGFGVPINNWLKKELRAKLDDYLNPDRIKRRGLFKPEYVLNLKEAFTKDQNVLTYELWSLLCLEIWLENNFK